MKQILIVGAGITGITLAERFASKGCKVLILERRNHIGGNCYDFKNKDGILVTNTDLIFFIQITKRFGIIFQNLLNGFLMSIKFWVILMGNLPQFLLI